VQLNVNAEVQWKNIKECVLDTISDLVGKVEKRYHINLKEGPSCENIRR
jgi:hypothetical protein